MRIYFVFCLMLAYVLSYGQIVINDGNVSVGVVTITPEIDGRLDEPEWFNQSPAKDFTQYFPTDTTLAKAKTELYLMSDEENLYVGIKCLSNGNDWIVPSLRRDYRAGGNDNITLVFDSFNDKTNALFFGINPEGVIREGLVSNGGSGRRDFSESWDNKWFGKSHKFDGGYSAELVIPFSTLRYKSGNSKWGLLSYRFDTQENEWSTWPGVPQNQILYNLSHVGEMNWEQAPPPSKSNISIIPYMTSSVNKDFENGTPASKTFAMGGDVKMAINSGLNLDVTINPDFSQVEVDRQITNLSRFELFFPERRQFFLENADLFGQFGFSGINPFFSRRIGVGVDTSTNITVQNKIIGGARLSGKLNQDTRIGILNMQTAANDDQGLPSTNYSVLAFQKKVFSRSNISIIGVNKQSFGENIEGLGLNKYNRVAGIDFNFANDDNSWSGKTFTHASFTSGGRSAIAHGTEVNLNKRNYGGSTNFSYVGSGYNAETGFVQRTNVIQSRSIASLKFYPGGKINTIRPTIFSRIIWKPGFGTTDRTLALGLTGQFNNNVRFDAFLSNDFVYLFNGFDPTGTGSESLKGDTAYNYWSINGGISTDMRKAFSARISPFIGQYFNGHRFGARGSATYRYTPHGFVQLNYSVNVFDMPHLEENKTTVLIGPRIDYTLSKSFFTTLFVQYNSQSQNTNINARLQWRFAPVSDFFLVYTDNYLTGNMIDPANRFAFDVRNRSIVAKLTYWLNV